MESASDPRVSTQRPGWSRRSASADRVGTAQPTATTVTAPGPPSQAQSLVQAARGANRKPASVKKPEVAPTGSDSVRTKPPRSRPAHIPFPVTAPVAGAGVEKPQTTPSNPPAGATPRARSTAAPRTRIPQPPIAPPPRGVSRTRRGDLVWPPPADEGGPIAWFWWPLTLAVLRPTAVSREVGRLQTNFPHFSVVVSALTADFSTRGILSGDVSEYGPFSQGVQRVLFDPTLAYPAHPALGCRTAIALHKTARRQPCTVPEEILRIMIDFVCAVEAGSDVTVATPAPPPPPSSSEDERDGEGGDDDDGSDDGGSDDGSDASDASDSSDHSGSSNDSDASHDRDGSDCVGVSATLAGEPQCHNGGVEQGGGGDGPTPPGGL